MWRENVLPPDWFGDYSHDCKYASNNKDNFIQIISETSSTSTAVSLTINFKESRTTWLLKIQLVRF